MKLRRPVVADLASALGAWSMVRTDGPEPVVPLSPATPESLDFYEDPREARVPRITGELHIGATHRNNGLRPYARDGWSALVPDGWSGRVVKEMVPRWNERWRPGPNPDGSDWLRPVDVSRWLVEVDPWLDAAVGQRVQIMIHDLRCPRLLRAHPPR